MKKGKALRRACDAAHRGLIRSTYLFCEQLEKRICLDTSPPTATLVTSSTAYTVNGIQISLTDGTDPSGADPSTLRYSFAFSEGSLQSDPADTSSSN